MTKIGTEFTDKINYKNYNFNKIIEERRSYSTLTFLRKTKKSYHYKTGYLT